VVVEKGVDESGDEKEGMRNAGGRVLARRNAGPKAPIRRVFDVQCMIALSMVDGGDGIYQ